MASMSTEIAVLRALLRLSHRRAPATLEDIVASVREGSDDVQRALASLARSQLVQRAGETARLSLSGLAVAVALAAQARDAKRRAKTVDAASPRTRVIPMVRRRRAA